MRVMLRSMTVLLAVAAAGCSSDGTTGSTGIAGLRPPAALSRPLAAEPSLSGQVITPIPAPLNGQLSVGVAMRNGTSETVTSGSCAEAIDARAVNGDTWYDVTAASQVCVLRALIIRPGDSGVVGIAVDQAKLRAVAGGAGRPVIVRIRTIVTGEDRSYAMTSATQQVTAP